MQNNANEVVKTKKQRKKEAKEKLTPKQRLFKEMREWVFALLTALVIVIVMKNYVFMPIRVDGNSMNPTLVNGQRLGVSVYDTKITNNVQRGDVVICTYPGRTSKDPLLGIITTDTCFVKRVVGVPGDTVSRVRGVTYINGSPLDPDYFNPYTRKVDYEYVLGDDEYFVVGDNRYNSHDSRTWDGPDSELNLVNDASSDVGPITSDRIVGRVRFVFWPISEAHFVLNDTEYVDPSDR